MREKIIGREQEILELEEILASERSEFVAVCGRRRVGKTFLIDEFFEGNIVFKTAGIANMSKAHQIKAFHKELLDRGIPPQWDKPKDWFDVFFLLRKFLEQSEIKRKVVILDELPWMDTPRSGFIAAIEHFWNSWGSSRHDIVLVVCGSSTSWMMNKLINSHGGLYNRTTHRIFLEPFNLRETEMLLNRNGFLLSRYEICELYMILGGIPFYLDMLRPSLSLSQNIDDLIFRENGALHNEFDNLYAALFKNSDDYIKVVQALSAKRSGLTRYEIVKTAKIPSGGGLSTILDNLRWCGFIRIVPNYNAKRRDTTLYQLIDNYSLFYFRFLKNKGNSEHTWSGIQNTPVFYNWLGLSYEIVCANHINQIKAKLGISGVSSSQYAWRCTDENGGAQIDLVIDRNDNTVNLCEMKFCIGEYSINGSYIKELRNMVAKFQNAMPLKKSLQVTFVTTYGLEKNEYSGIVNNVVLLDDLFGS